MALIPDQKRSEDDYVITPRPPTQKIQKNYKTPPYMYQNTSQIYYLISQDLPYPNFHGPPIPDINGHNLTVFWDTMFYIRVVS
jgi:hypothetical protein